MKKLMLCAGCVIAFALVITGCASTPKTESGPAPVAEVAPVEAAEPQPVDEALAALRDRMEALRADCLKYRLDTFMNDAWTAAESVRRTGLDAYGKDNALAKTSFEDAIARYENVKKDGFALAAAELEAELARARAEAIASGANSYYPEQFALADKTSSDSSALRDSGDASGSYDAAQLALLRYRILIEGMKAVACRQKIEKNDFAQYAPDDFRNGDDKYSESAASFGTADAAALESMTASVLAFRKVCNAGYRAWAQPEIAKADEARALCDSIKASKSMKREYDSAMWKYDQGSGAGARDDWESAYDSYADSAVEFSNVYQSASLKRNAADAAISAAKARQKSSSDLAVKADQLAPLPENAEGYSEDPYVIESSVDSPVADTQEAQASDDSVSTDGQSATSVSVEDEDPAPSDESAVPDAVSAEESNPGEDAE